VTVRAFLRTANVGGFAALVISGLSVAAGLLRVHGSIATGSSETLVQIISWPTVIISILAMTLAYKVTRVYRKPERVPRHAGR
jgi:hypothetical protein